MNLITVNHLTKTYDGDIILDDIQFSLNSNEKTAIVGRNGAGKSTLIKIICGLEPYDKGDIFISSNINIGYFSQDSLIDSNQTVLNEMRDVFKKQITMQKELDEMANRLKTNNDEQLLTDYNRLLQSFEEIGGYTFEYQIETMLNQFYFKDYYNHPVNQLSGGQRTRLALAKLLLSEPDVLVLDEPTNHLDLETLEYLENFLRAYKQSVIIISHDRYFLNQVVNQVYEIEFNKGFLYKGNYDRYLSQKEERLTHQQKEFDQQQKMIKKEEEFIEKNIVRASTTKQAQSRRKKLEKLTIIENPKENNKNIHVDFSFSRNTGKMVLELKHLSIGYEKAFLNNINLYVKKNEKIAILGPNGIGKSTLLKCINKTIPALHGDIRYGANVNIAYFDQDLAMLNSSKSVIDELWDENRTMLEKEIRTILGSFLFTGDDVFKCVNDLSGGEKVRLALSKLMLKKANLLILDEVTNHLDILGREVLEKALNKFEGTILFVSHDRYFINKVATKIVELSPHHVQEYMGGYSYYLEKRRELKDNDKKENSNKDANDFIEQKRRKSELRKKEKTIVNLEKEIEELETEIESLKTLQSQEEVYLDYQKSQDVHDQIETKQKDLDELIHKWTELNEIIELERGEFEA